MNRGSLLFGLLCFFIAASQAQGLNGEVLKIANEFSGGTYKWSGSGAPKAIYFKDQKILSKSSQGSFCSGYTFTVAFETLYKKQKLDEFTTDDIRWLQRNWYGTNDQSAETQCLYALEKLNLGKEISPQEARAGDFVQFWRNNKSGHSVVFLAWVKDDKGEITGIKYRSSQKATNGIGDRTETIGEQSSDINPKRLYIVRLKD